MTGKRRAPAGLRAAGKRLWRDVTDGYGLRPDETRALEAACRTADELADLEAALADAPPMVAGSKGQPRPNPLYAEVRSHRLALRQLLAAVGLVDAHADAGDAAASRSTAGRRLARQRWDRRGLHGVG